MELTVDLGPGGWIYLVTGAVLFGASVQYFGQPQTGFDWLVDAIAAGIGALLASEGVVAWQAWGPIVDGLAVVPAVLGGLAVGLAVEIVVRYVTGRWSTHGTMSA